MDTQKLLEQQAAELSLPLTPLSQMNHYTRSDKIACCGGTVVRVVTESSADSTISIRDASGTCFCAVHGDITNAYPDVLTAGALVVLTNVTLLVTSGKVPPLLIACLDNLAGLMLPEPDDTGAAPLVADDAWGIDRPTLPGDNVPFLSGTIMEDSMPPLLPPPSRQPQISPLLEAAYDDGVEATTHGTPLDERQSVHTPHTRVGSSLCIADNAVSDGHSAGIRMNGAALLGAVPFTSLVTLSQQQENGTATHKHADKVPENKEEDCLELVDDL